MEIAFEEYQGMYYLRSQTKAQSMTEDNRRQRNDVIMFDTNHSSLHKAAGQSDSDHICRRSSCLPIQN